MTETASDQPVRRVSRRELMASGVTLGATALASQYGVGGVLAQSGGPTDVISGTVTDGSGGVDGATVVAVPHDSSLDPLVTTTAIDGTYSFEQADLHDGENLYHVIARDGTETSPRRGQENYPFIAAEGVSAIPDSSLYHYPVKAGSGSTLTEELQNEDATLNGPTWITDTWWESTAVDGDGTDDYISFPSAISSWIASNQNTWMAFTVDADPADISANDVIFGFLDGSQTPTEFWLIDDPNGDGSIRWAMHGSSDNRDSITSDGTPLNGSKNRVVLQRTGTTGNDLEMYINTSQETVTVNSADGFGGAFDSPDADLFGLARNEGGTGNLYMNSAFDNAIIGELGSTLTASEIQDDYDAQPWS